MTRSTRLMISVICVSCAAMGFAPRFGEEEPVTSKSALGKMKSLDGEWAAVTDGNHGGGEAKVSYRITSNGTSVMETQFPGTDHEMISMYVLDGEDLHMTHYCAIGNHPHLKLDKKASKPDKLVFQFDGGTNFDPKKDMHIHGVTFSFKGEGEVEADWEGYMGGKPAGNTIFKMKKAKK